ncbi:MAG: DoxX family protein [Saprospiraceae bacterium]|jgi:uncharacterized membrane protein|nr:DoxX family protein [Saprospiraceae bacterium]MBL0023753.1 DoxX family protein [Saprospiraceae bacterium]
MNNVIGWGKYLFAVPFGIFGILHFISADQLASMAPGGKPMVYIAGIALIAAAVSIIIGKLDKLASLLLALLLILLILPHAQNLSTDESQFGNILKNISLAGGALMYASMAKDKKYVD